MSYLIVTPKLPVPLVGEERRHEEATRGEVLEYCAWCWDQRHPGYPYPDVTSHICPACKNAQVALLSARRAARAVRNVEVIA